jgi:hypothetical protein
VESHPTAAPRASHAVVQTTTHVIGFIMPISYVLEIQGQRGADGIQTADPITPMAIPA